MLVKRESTSRLAIGNSEFCSIVSLAKAYESFTAYSLLVKNFNIGTRNFANLLVRVLILDKISWNGGKWSKISL